MRKYLFLVAIFLTSLLFSQPATREAIIVVPDKTVAFGVAVNAGAIVCELDSNAFYEITASFSSTHDMGDVFTANEADKLGDKQTIYLTGDITGSGIFSIATTISADAVESGMLNNNIISGQTELASGLASTDEFLISDNGVLKRMDVSVLDGYIDHWTDQGTYLEPTDDENIRVDKIEGDVAPTTDYIDMNNGLWYDAGGVEFGSGNADGDSYVQILNEDDYWQFRSGGNTAANDRPLVKYDPDSLMFRLSDSLVMKILPRSTTIHKNLYLDEVYNGAAGDTTLLVRGSDGRVKWLYPDDLGISGGSGGSGDVVAGTGFAEGRVLFGGSSTNEANGDANMTFNATNRKLSIDSIAALGLQFTTTPGDGDAHAENVVMNSDGRIKTKGYTGDVMSFTVGNAFAANEIGYLRSDNKMYHTDADGESTSAGLLGVALESISSDASGDFMLKGIITTSGLTTGDEMYLSTTAGTWTSTAPSASADIVRIIGACLSSTEIWFNPDWTYLEIE